MSPLLAVFPACTTCGKLNPRSEIVECATFTCKTPRGASPPCTSCLNLNKLEDQIAQAEAFLDHLKSHRTALRSDVNRVHDPFINQIPLEVASRILTFCLEDCESPIGSMIKENHHIPFVLGAICQRWRDVALSTPVLWTFLALKLDGVPMSLGYEKTLTTVLGRSGQYPLRFSLRRCSSGHLPTISLCRNVINILNQHSHRWRTIDICIPPASIPELRGNGSSTSILKQLRIIPLNLDNNWAIPEFCLQNALPSPRSVTIYAMRFKSVSIDWSNVTKVEIKGLHVDECLQLIQDAPRLRDCTLDNIQDGDSSIPSHETIIKHTSITALEIHFTSNVLPHLLLDCVSLPSLKSLVFRCCGHSLEALTSYIRNCSPPLTHLHIADYGHGSDHSTELSRLLWLAPTITHLTLSYIPLTDAVFQHFHAPVRANIGREEPQFLPRLTNFEFNFDNTMYEVVPFPWQRLSGSLLSRFKNSDGFPWPLRTFDMEVTTDPSNNSYILNEDAVAEFEELMEYGVRIQLSNRCDEKFTDMIAHSKAYHQRGKVEAELT